MRAFVIRRALISILLLWIVATIVFITIQMSPGNPVDVYAGTITSKANISAIRAFMGLNHPVVVQYWLWLLHAVRGELGRSLFTRDSVSSLLWARVPITLELVGAAIVVSTIVGIVLGAVAAWRRNTALDIAIRSVTLVGLSLPGFWVALLLLLLFGVYYYGYIPTSGWVSPTQSLASNLDHMILPVFVLALPNIAVITRTLRVSMIDTLGRDYVTFAKSVSVSVRTLIDRVVLPNAIIPTATVAGLATAYLLGGTVIVEYVFTIPGVGQLMTTSYLQHDFPVAIGCTLFIAAAAIFMNFLVDIFYAFANPKVRELYEVRVPLREM